MCVLYACARGRSPYGARRRASAATRRRASANRQKGSRMIIKFKNNSATGNSLRVRAEAIVAFTANDGGSLLWIAGIAEPLWVPDSPTEVSTLLETAHAQPR